MNEERTAAPDDELPGMLAVAKGVAEQKWPHSMDAEVWAAEFKKRYPDSDEGDMIGWFANAIMAGYDTAQARAARSERREIYYERRPNLDKRISLGDDFAGDAWVRWTAVGHTPNDAAPQDRMGEPSRDASGNSPASNASSGDLPAVAAPVCVGRRIDLTRYINAASIGAGDGPHEVVQKLQVAINEQQPAIEGTYLSQSAANHLRRLVAWVRCDVGQSPEELVDTVKHLATKIDDISEEGKQRLVVAHQEAAAVPKYVRAAVKALEKAIAGVPE